MRLAAVGLAPEVNEALRLRAGSAFAQGLQHFRIAPGNKVVQRGSEVGGDFEQ